MTTTIVLKTHAWPVDVVTVDLGADGATTETHERVECNEERTFFVHTFRRIGFTELDANTGESVFDEPKRDVVCKVLETLGELDDKGQAAWPVDAHDPSPVQSARQAAWPVDAHDPSPELGQAEPGPQPEPTRLFDVEAEAIHKAGYDAGFRAGVEKARQSDGTPAQIGGELKAAYVKGVRDQAEAIAIACMERSNFADAERRMMHRS